MFKSKENLAQSCSPPEDIVAYLYGEMGAGPRGTFETHLADCDHCTSELADLSFARLDVYEWHRDEFLGMETPEIVVPFAHQTMTWLEAARAFFSAQGRLAFAGGAFAVMAIALAGTYIAFRPAAGDLAREGNVTPPPVERTAPAATPGAQAIPEPDTAEDDKRSKDSNSVPAAVRISAPVRKPAASGRAVDAKPKGPAERTTRTRRTAPPRLNDFEDEEDTTLRLGDLLAEIDAKE